MESCARCRYSLRGLDSVVCPECGLANDEASVRRFRNQCTGQRVFIGCGAMLVLSLFCLLFSSLTFIGPNLGLPFGYYGELNRVKASVEAIEGVRIVRLRVNDDLTIEEISADVVIDETHRATID